MTQNTNSIKTFYNDTYRMLDQANALLGAISRLGVRAGAFVFNRKDDKDIPVSPAYVSVFLSCIDMPMYDMSEYSKETQQVMQIHSKLRFIVFNLNENLRALATERVRYAIKIEEHKDLDPAIPTRIEICILFETSSIPDFLDS